MRGARLTTRTLRALAHAISAPRRGRAYLFHLRATRHRHASRAPLLPKWRFAPLDWRAAIGVFCRHTRWRSAHGGRRQRAVAGRTWKASVNAPLLPLSTVPGTSSLLRHSRHAAFAPPCNHTCLTTPATPTTPPSLAWTSGSDCGLTSTAATSLPNTPTTPPPHTTLYAPHGDRTDLSPLYRGTTPSTRWARACAAAGAGLCSSAYRLHLLQPPITTRMATG